MKKFLAVICALLMVLGFCGCTEYREPVTSENGGADGSGGSGGNQTDITTPDDTTTEPFTVTLVCSGVVVDIDEDIYAIWTSSDGREIYTANFTNGVASTTKPDGDYVITLSKMPSSYTYNPNIYSASNNYKNVTITLYRLSSASSNTKSFSAFNSKLNSYVGGQANILPSIGAYRITLKSPSDVAYFYYKPDFTGVYTATSMMDITENVINPILDIYSSNSGGYCNYQDTQDSGGSSSTYTKNFLYEMTLYDVGNSFFFAVRTTSIRADAFPVQIDFMLDKDGELSGSDAIEYEIVYPTHFTDPNYVPFEQQYEDYTEGKTFTYAGDDNRVEGVALGVLDETLYAYNEEIGYYCRYDSEKGEFLYYDEDKKIPIILFAKLSGIKMMDIGDFCTNTYLNYRCDGIDYERYFRAWDEDGEIAFSGDTPLSSYTYIDPYTGIQYTNTTYTANLNSDGCYPVTKELKVALMAYSVKARLFNDGNGEGEQYFASAEADQWLIFCGIYK
jgi:hypothetical protein